MTSDKMQPETVIPVRMETEEATCDCLRFFCQALCKAQCRKGILNSAQKSPRDGETELSLALWSSWRVTGRLVETKEPIGKRTPEV